RQRSTCCSATPARHATSSDGVTRRVFRTSSTKWSHATSSRSAGRSSGRIAMTEMTTLAERTKPLFDLAGKRVYVAGHRGMVGGAIVRRLESEKCEIVTADRRTLDLTRQADTEAWLDRIRPDVVVVAAARVGGIAYNNAFPVEFLADNLAIELN